MDRNIKIIVLKNEIEANIIATVLKEKNIPHIIMSYHDSAYDGLFQMQKGWGHIEAPPEYKSRILKIYQDITK
jgi:hypothetical protein